MTAVELYTVTSGFGGPVREHKSHLYGDKLHSLFRALTQSELDIAE
jgi:hypothetical protein